MSLYHPDRPRRYHSAEFKAQLIALCQRPGVSVAGVALEHGLNANLLRRWIRQYSDSVPRLAPSMVPIRLESPAPISPDDALVLDIQRGSVRVHVRCPASAADACAHLLRGWLK
ncbi:MAG: transposase [Halothiobacillus sp.]|jgi:transposase|nr:transposase [Halothiobacillus sp.]